jgi:hypothetical protein
MDKKDWKSYVYRAGWVGFLFFFIKGLAWLAVFYGLGKWGCM